MLKPLFYFLKIILSLLKWEFTIFDYILVDLRK